MKKRLTLTQIMHRAVKYPPSGQDARQTAARLGLNYQSMMSSLSGQERHHLNADLVLPLSMETGSDAAVNYLAQGLGGVFVRLPVPAGYPCRAELIKSLARAIHEFGDLVADAAEAFEDGRVEGAELLRFEERQYAALNAIVTMGMIARENHKEMACECQG